jgi:MoxR-like ATPase
MAESKIFQQSLTGTPSIGWNLARLARERYPKLAMLDGVQDPFDICEFSRANKCEATPSADETAHFRTSWSRAHGLHVHPLQAVYDVRWREHDLKVIVASWRDGFDPISQSQVLAETIEIAREFANEVCAFCNHPGNAIMRFQNGCWSKSNELWQMVQASSFDDLVLAGDLKERIVEDFSSFLGARAEYERYKVPHKRGVLLLGPPGNGKTHCLRALIKFLDVPCLYVMSLKARYTPEDASIDAVFTRARELTPCCLVFEDLDAMIHDKNRSYFLNQLDGISNASGLLTLATTNHPERLDPAIVDRPSRFDRKYHFDLPGETERRRYLAQWNARLEGDMRVTEEELDGLARDTVEYSFAYLKELYLSAIMRWMSHRRGREMGTELRGQVKALREQMKTGAHAQAAHVPSPSEDDED